MILRNFSLHITRKRALDPLQSKAVFPREKEKTRRVSNTQHAVTISVACMQRDDIESEYK